MTRDDFIRVDVVVQLGLPPRRIDVLTSVSGLTFADAWEDRLEQEVDGLRVPFLGRTSLIRNKQASGRPKDLGDLDALGLTEGGEAVVGDRRALARLVDLLGTDSGRRR